MFVGGHISSWRSCHRWWYCYWRKYVSTDEQTDRQTDRHGRTDWQTWNHLLQLTKLVTLQAAVCDLDLVTYTEWPTSGSGVWPWHSSSWSRCHDFCCLRVECLSIGVVTSAGAMVAELVLCLPSWCYYNHGEVGFCPMKWDGAFFSPLLCYDNDN